MTSIRELNDLQLRRDRVQAMITLASQHPGAPQLHKDIAAEIAELRAERDEARDVLVKTSLLLGYAQGALRRVEALLVSDDEYRIKSVPARDIRAALQNPEPTRCVQCDHGVLDHMVDDEERRQCRLCMCLQYQCATPTPSSPT